MSCTEQSQGNADRTQATFFIGSFEPSECVLSVSEEIPLG